MRVRTRDVVPDAGQVSLFGLPPALVVVPGGPAEAQPFHALARRSGGGFDCVVCQASWQRRPASRCPGVRLYRSWSDVPADELRTRSSWRRAGRLVPKHAPVDAVVEAHANRPRRMLYREARSVPVRPLTPAQLAAVAARRRCGWPGCEAEGDPLRDTPLEWVLPYRRCCGTHYRAAWLERQRAVALGDLEALTMQRPVAIDLETTGLVDPVWPVEVGVWADGRSIFRARVRPPADASWEAGAVAVHGIRPEDVAGERPWEEVLPELVDALAPLLGHPDAPHVEGEPLPGHLWAWGELDGRVLHGASHRVGQRWPWTVWDACDWWRRAWPDIEPRRSGSAALEPRWRLAEACSRASVRPGDHTALEDARALSEVLDWMLRGLDPAERPQGHPLRLLDDAEQLDRSPAPAGDDPSGATVGQAVPEASG